MIYTHDADTIARNEKMAQPTAPNVLVTGTPGTGKSTLCALLSAELGLRHLDVGAFARERQLLGAYDAVYDCNYLDEDSVLDALEPVMVSGGGTILDHHSVDWFPERWTHLVVVLRASTHILHDRLSARGYGKKKLDENMQAEIMQVVLDEAKQSYPKIQVLELLNDTVQQQTNNVKVIKTALNKLRTGNNAASTQLVQ